MGQRLARFCREDTHSAAFVSDTERRIGEGDLCVRILRSAVYDVTRGLEPRSNPALRRGRLVGSRHRIQSFDRWQSYDLALAFFFAPRRQSLFESIAWWAGLDPEPLREGIAYRLEQTLGPDQADEEIAGAVAAYRTHPQTEAMMQRGAR